MAQVRLDDVNAGEDDIQRSKEDTTDRVLLQPVADQDVEIPQDLLVGDVRRGRHVVLPIDQLVPFAVVGKQQEVVVCELHARIRAHHVITPGHGLIIATGSETDATSSDSGLSRKVKSAFRNVRRFVVVEVV